MSELAEDFKALKAFHKSEREAQAETNLAALKASNLSFKEQTKNVYRIDTNRGVVMYYPPSSRWQYRGKTIRGTPEDLRNWLKRQGMLK